MKHSTYLSVIVALFVMSLTLTSFGVIELYNLASKIKLAMFTTWLSQGGWFFIPIGMIFIAVGVFAISVIGYGIYQDIAANLEEYQYSRKFKKTC